MLKTTLCLSLCLYVIALPVQAALTPQDLDKIRLIIHETNAPIKAEIASVKDELSKEITAVKDELSGKIASVKDELSKENASVKDELSKEIAAVRNEVTEMRGSLDGLNRMVTWLMVLIGVVVGIPQILMTWRSRKDRAQEEQIQELRREIEMLKQRHIVNP